MRKRELVVIGGGPAGMAAAEAARNEGVRDILLIERDAYLGGILNQCVHTGFGLEYFKEVLTGPEYAARFIGRIEADPQIEVSLRSIVVKLTADRRVAYLKRSKLEEVQARVVILATGCRERTREMIHIPGDRPAGIFSAGLAQKLINIEGLMPGKRVVIVGSGDIGLIMARRFTLEGAEVRAVIELQDKPSGLLRNLVQCVEDFGIPTYFNHKITRVYGRHRVEKVSVARVDEALQEVAGSEFELECDTVLVSVGLIPENELLEEAEGKIAEEAHKTSIPGIYICGNSAKVYDLVDWVTRDSEDCGRAAAKYNLRG